MWITTDEAIEIYARFLNARYGERAPMVAQEKSDAMRDTGDSDGERVWQQVMQTLERRSAN